MKNKLGKKYISLFEKSVILMIVFGIIPLLIIGYSLFQHFSNRLKDTLLSNTYQMAIHISNNLTDIVDEMDKASRYLYNYNITDYDYLYELYMDPAITEAKRQVLITEVLRNIVYTSQYIDNVYFIDKTQQVYFNMRPPERMVNRNTMVDWHKDNFKPENKKLSVLPTHVSNYFYYSDNEVFTFVRNIMDTRTIQSSEKEVLGTLYIDVNISRIENLVKEITSRNQELIYILDTQTKEYVYHPSYYKLGMEAADISPYIPQMKEDNYYIHDDGQYLVYKKIPDTNWLAVVQFSDHDMSSSYGGVKNYTIVILLIASVLLMFIYYLFSKKINNPIQQLKDAMLEIQNGDLDTRVSIETNDETAILAEGLNQMAENLQNHIEQEYVAKIRQRDAKLEALKNQIQPHYLYNTLDVIRMGAITNDDFETAEMIDSLSGQLKYMIGTSQDMVLLKAEIENIKDYFKLIRFRYENRFDLELDIPNELLSLKVPHLILQPAVENAVKHGLKPKVGPGRIEIKATLAKEALTIIIMDNGIGMSDEKLNEIYTLLEGSDPGIRKDDNWESVGIKNVYDRIRINFGTEYGVQMTSCENIGTHVQYTLPIIKGEQDYVV